MANGGRTSSLQRSLVVVVPESFTTDEKGKFLEDLAEQVLTRQSFEVIKRIRFTGMEVDLVARHKPSHDEVYVECKFQKDRVGSNVVDLMVGQAFRRKVRRLALVSVGELTKDAKAAVEELKNDDRLSFSHYDAEEFLNALLDSSLAPPLPPSVPASVLHATLLAHPEHPYTWLLQEQKDGRPNRILVDSSSDLDLVDLRGLLDAHEVLEGLPVAGLEIGSESTPVPTSAPVVTEVVSRVATADTILDYRPCAPEDFVGRRNLQKEIWDFLESARLGKTKTRILAVVGASGFGKSSLVAKLASRFRNRKWKNRLFLYPVDVRSARGPLFVAEALLHSIRSAAEAGFIEAPPELAVSDADDILGSPSVCAVLDRLKQEKKVLAIFFDQFEEVFTKDDLLPVFRTFRRFALDINGKSPSLVVGFSWRTGIALSESNPAYQLWNELRDHRITKSLGPFDSGESSRLITQFESALGENLLPPLRRGLQEQGQGLPWLLKKLCIHVYNQVKRGVSQADLLGSRLNVERLFDEDLEPLNDAQLSCLKHIAANSPADSLDVYDRYGDEVVASLVSSRLVLRTGQRLAVYWDIFRDYLTDGIVPTIPWTYIPNCTVGMAYAAAEYLHARGALETAALAKALGYSERTVVNIITDLQNLAAAGKDERGRHRLLSEVTAETLPDRIRAQFREHVLYEEISRAADGDRKLSREKALELVRRVYSKINVKSQTRDNYLPRILSWLEFAGLVETDGRSIEVMEASRSGEGFGRVSGRIGRRKAKVFLGAATPEASLRLLGLIRKPEGLSRDQLLDMGLRNAATDLVALGLAEWRSDDCQATASGAAGGERESLASAALNSHTLRIIDEVLTASPSISRKNLGLELSDRLERDWKPSSALRYANGLCRYRAVALAEGREPAG